MLNQTQIIKSVQSGRKSGCIDGRDYSRLVDFFQAEQWGTFGIELKEGAEPPEPRPWTEEEVKKQLAEDVGFGFEKALDQRGISSGLMYEVVKMWLWVLGDPLQHNAAYAEYGLPLFKAAALKYGFPNPIGEKQGNEHCYAG